MPEILPADKIHFGWYFPSETVQRSLEAVQNGEVLSEARRKLCVKFLCSIDMYTNQELAAIFRVPEMVIVRDLADIVDERNEVIGAVKPVSIISEFIENQTYAIKKLRQTIEQGELRSKDKISAIDKYSIANMRLIEVLQSLGLMPKELGSLAITQEKWVASIAEDGTPLFEKTDDSAKGRGLLGEEIKEVIPEDVEDL